MLFINESTIVGQTFTTTADPNSDWVCVGYAANDTFLIVGSNFDSTNNRTTLKTFKFQDVRFKGQLPAAKL